MLKTNGYGNYPTDNGCLPTTKNDFIHLETSDVDGCMALLLVGVGGASVSVEEHLDDGLLVVEFPHLAGNDRLGQRLLA